MLEGPNIELCKNIAEATKGKVTLSGGISSYKDLINLQECSSCGIDSVIIGRALYENKFACQKIWRVAEAGIFD
jgi:phosphoribosylformimino-5-aminoimidazole carboxamide ribotide isomerase